MPAPNRLIFGAFLLDLQDARLWRGTEVVRIGTKAFDVLRCLTTAQGQLVTKEMLLETVWPEAVVGEAVVAVAIRELRRALGDMARTPQFIETVHGRGYRFIASVTVADASLDTPNSVGEAVPERLAAPDSSGIFVGREAELARQRHCFVFCISGAVVTPCFWSPWSMNWSTRASCKQTRKPCILQADWQPLALGFRRASSS